MNNETKKRLVDALEACRAIQEFTTGSNFAAYAVDAMRRSWDWNLTPRDCEARLDYEENGGDVGWFDTSLPCGSDGSRARTGASS
jgi:hypothetical protein